MPTQHSDIYNPTAPAIQYSKSGQSWKIADGVQVGSGSTLGAIYSSFNGSKLVNKGEVYAGDHNGLAVYINAQENGTFINKAGASIVGGFGVAMGNIAGSKNMTVTNHGTIIGFANYGVAADDVSNFNLTNTGHIFGAVYGVFATVVTPGVGDGPTIDNSGSIRGGAGIWLIVLSGLTTTVVNETGGIIKGAPAGAIYNTGPGNLLVENHGKIKGDIVGNVAKDRVVNDGTIKGDIYLNDGDDIYKNKGGHADKVHGGLGNDTLIAGPHTDKFVFDTLLDPVNNVDRVKNFDPGTDKLFLSKAIFGALTGPGILLAGEFHKGSSAHDATDHIIYDTATGNLYYDPDGLGGTGQIQFAKLDKDLHLHASDFTVFA